MTVVPRDLALHPAWQGALRNARCMALDWADRRAAKLASAAVTRGRLPEDQVAHVFARVGEGRWRLEFWPRWRSASRRWGVTLMRVERLGGEGVNGRGIVPGPTAR